MPTEHDGPSIHVHSDRHVCIFPILNTWYKMVTIPATAPASAAPRWRRSLLPWRSPEDQPSWARPGAAGHRYRSGGRVQLGNGRASVEPFYGAAARSMSQNWHDVIFGAFDPAGTVTTGARRRRHVRRAALRVAAATADRRRLGRPGLPGENDPGMAGSARPGARSPQIMPPPAVTTSWPARPGPGELPCPRRSVAAGGELSCWSWRVAGRVAEDCRVMECCRAGRGELPGGRRRVF